MFGLYDALKQANSSMSSAKSPTDLTIGTVISVDPLEIQISPELPPIPNDMLLLTEFCVDKTIRFFAHTHTPTGTVHRHVTESGDTGPAAGATGNTWEIFGSQSISNGEIIDDKESVIDYPYDLKISKRIDVGERVVMLKVLNGQKFIVLSRVLDELYIEDD